MRKILITGVAGFIGYHLASGLLEKGDIEVIGIDNLNNYYDINLKNSRLSNLNKYTDFSFEKIDITDMATLEKCFTKHKFTHVVNLAAQAGVRYAKENPDAYVDANVLGFYNIIDMSSKTGVDRFLYASSSSVYGSNTSIPFRESDPTNSPMSLYAATKIANEAIASAYFYTNKINTVGLRFFNVYGPWGRPDMAYYKWTDALTNGTEIELRAKGQMWRDMTYIDDVVYAMISLLDSDFVQHEPKVLNIGNQSPVKISDVLDFLTKYTKVNSKIKHFNKGEEEPVKTWADTAALSQLIGYSPNTDYTVGLEHFLKWHKQYHKR